MRRAHEASISGYYHITIKPERAGGVAAGGQRSVERRAGAKEPWSLGANECQTSVTEAAEEAMEQQKSGAKVGDKRHLSTSKVM
jgi:hypothetical protein